MSWVIKIRSYVRSYSINDRYVRHSVKNNRRQNDETEKSIVEIEILWPMRLVLCVYTSIIYVEKCMAWRMGICVCVHVCALYLFIYFVCFSLQGQVWRLHVTMEFGARIKRFRTHAQRICERYSEKWVAQVWGPRLFVQAAVANNSEEEEEEEEKKGKKIDRMRVEKNVCRKLEMRPFGYILLSKIWHFMNYVKSTWMSLSRAHFFLNTVRLHGAIL